MSNYNDWTDQELRDHAQGCTEATCPYHGRFNMELQRRGSAEGYLAVCVRGLPE
jgi:hypothetical protein